MRHHRWPETSEKSPERIHTTPLLGTNSDTTSSVWLLRQKHNAVMSPRHHITRHPCENKCTATRTHKKYVYTGAPVVLERDATDHFAERRAAHVICKSPHAQFARRHNATTSVCIAIPRAQAPTAHHAVADDVAGRPERRVRVLLVRRQRIVRLHNRGESGAIPAASTQSAR
jgi:hypothetical protein